MTYRLPKKTLKPEDVERAAKEGFMRGFITCLSNLTHGGRSISNTDIKAWQDIGEPDAKTVAKLGLSGFDRRTCTLFRAETKIRNQ